MMKWKFYSQIILALLLTTSLVSALGVSPGRVNVDYVPGGTFETTACFKASSTPIIRIDKSGFLADYIELLNVPKDGLIDLRTSDGCVKYRVTLPLEVDTPGVHLSDIGATEVPGEAGGNIVAIVRMSHIIQLNVPYPGKYLEITGYSVPNTRVNESMPITVNVKNKGNESINLITGVITFFNKDDSQVGQVALEPVSNFQPLETKEFKLKWDSKGLQAGNYQANLIIDYDGSKAAENKSFKLGTLEVLVNSYTNPVTYKGIQPFSVYLDSLWSEAIPDAKATVSVYNLSAGPEVKETFDTLPATLKPWEGAELKGYMDTQKIGLGTYDIIIDLAFGGHTKEYNGTVEIIEPPKPAPVKKDWGKIIFSTTGLLVALVIVLLAILIIIIVVLLPKKKQADGKEKPPQQ